MHFIYKMLENIFKNTHQRFPIPKVKSSDYLFTLHISETPQDIQFNSKKNEIPAV